MQADFPRPMGASGSIPVEREAFLKSRAGGLGGSDMAVVLGVSPYKTRLQLYNEKRGVPQPPDPALEGDRQRGIVLEPIALAEALAALGHPEGAQLGRFVRPAAHPWLLLHPDVLLPTAVLDTKVPRARKFARVRNEGLPADWHIQLMTYMLGTERPAGFVYMWNADEWTGHLVEVAWDDALAERIVTEGAAFWRCVQEGTPPEEVQGTHRAPAVVKTGQVVRTDLQFETAINDYALARDAEEACKDRKESARQALIRLVGDRQFGKYVGGGYSLGYSERQGRQSFSVDEMLAHEAVSVRRLRELGLVTVDEAKQFVEVAGLTPSDVQRRGANYEHLDVREVRA